MAHNFNEIYQKALGAYNTHQSWLGSLETTVAYYYMGKPTPLVSRGFVFPFYQDVIESIGTYIPEAYNPMAYMINAFVDELANTELRTKVRPTPLTGKEPWSSYANHLEEHLNDIHRESRTKKDFRYLILSHLLHTYGAIYTNGRRYWVLSAYDFIPGDPGNPSLHDQPLIIRKTATTKGGLRKKGVNLLDSGLAKEFEKYGELDNINIWDVWVLSMDLNVWFTETGKVLFHQPFPKPKRYPFAAIMDRNIMNSWYALSMMTRLVPLNKKYKDALENLEESSKSIANPILTYDGDAGIDVNALQRALKEGYKRIIVGKNREGEIGFIAPGSLPAYSLNMPNVLADQMLKNLGLTQSFLGISSGVRERGAINRLLKTSFRQLATTASLFEDAFSEIDNYILDFVNAHQFTMRDKVSFKNIEEVFQGPVRYRAMDKFVGFASEDTMEHKNLIMLQSARKIISKEETLRQLGYENPKRILDQIDDDVKKQQEVVKEVQSEAQEPVKDLLMLVGERLNGRLNNKFELGLISDDKLVIRVAPAELDKTAFMLSDFSSQVFIEAAPELTGTAPALGQDSIEVKEEAPAPPPPVMPAEPKKPEEPTDGPEVETRGRPRTTPRTSPEALREAIRKLAELRRPPAEPIKKKEGPGNLKEQEVVSGRAVAPTTGITEFSEAMLRNLMARSRVLKKPERFFNLPGMFISEPHSAWIFTGKKSLIVKARKFDVIGKPHLLLGDKVYGVIVVRGIVDNFDFDKTQKFHMVSPQQARKWWKTQKLHLYMFEFFPFEMPLEWNRPQGIQTFVRKVDIKSEKTGAPQSGDIKAIQLKPWVIPPPHKPEKKSFQPNEVFSLTRLKELIPESSYDVSFKVDGLRTFLWIHKGEARLFSDEANRFKEERVAPIAEAAQKMFKQDVLLDGELVIKGIERKDVNGFIHTLGKPDPEMLKNLRLIVWDILYVKDKAIAGEPFEKRSAVLDLFVKFKAHQTGIIQRVHHIIAKDRDAVPVAAKKVMSNEGTVIRDLKAAYWATHSTYKMKVMFDIDAKVIAIEKTKTGLPVFHLVTREGIYVGQTFAQSEVKAKPGDTIRVNVQKTTLRPDGSIGWFAPRPISLKGRVKTMRPSLRQAGIGQPDTLGTFKEVYLATGGTEEKWKAWLPIHNEWVKEKMPKLIERIKEKIREGVPAART